MKNEFSIPGMEFDEIDMQIVFSTQAGIPVNDRPYLKIAEKLGISEDEIIFRMQKMKTVGFIRKIAAAVNHYKIGYVANAMTVWDIPEDNVEVVGKIFQGISSISHCYIRPRALPLWRYNLFAMVHGHNRTEVEEVVEGLKQKIEHMYEDVELIYSSKILKKTGIRLKAANNV